MLFARKDDEISQNIISWYKYLAVAILAGLILYWFIVMINKGLSSEKIINAVFIKRELQMEGRGRNSDFYFKGQDGRQYKIKVRHTKKLAKIGPLKPGKTVELKLRKGVFWTEISEIINGNHVYKKDI